MIHFQNNDFPTRTIELPNFGKVLISITSLNDSLLNDDSYDSDEAMIVDEAIFYFVEDGQINLPYNELRDVLISEVR